jgi:hypothetical protein
MTDRPSAGEASGLVRPFVITGGRTRPTVDLRIETQLVTIDEPDEVAVRDERHAVLHLCRTPQSLAEVSARLGLALGVARILVGDLVSDGKLKAHEAGAAQTGDSELLSRVLERLVAL